MPRTRGRRARGARRAGPRPRRARLRRRLGDRRSRGAIEAALSGEDTLVVCITGRNEMRPGEARAALRRQRAGADPRLHRADERLDGGRRRDDPLDRRPDRARGPHPRLPCRLLRLLGRPPAGQQRRLRALRPGRGRALRARARVGPAPPQPRAALARLLLRLAALDRLASARGAAAGPAAAGLAAARRAGRDRGQPGRDRGGHVASPSPTAKRPTR